MQNSVDSSNQNVYQSPLTARYASEEMLSLFSPQKRYSTWRKLWVALAEAQKQLGLNITDEQIQQLKSRIDTIDFSKVSYYEEKTHHDVVANLLAFADVCPKARSIIHIGATSCYVTDNADLIIIKKALSLIKKRLSYLIQELAKFCKTHASLPCLGFTHFQPAQLTTVGKRACLWLQDFVDDLFEIRCRRDNLHFLGVKGTTGTQASYFSLFGGNHEKVKQLDKIVQEMMGFEKGTRISGQTYSRKQDTKIFQALLGLACSAHKMATDIRLLAGLKELEEPFEKSQVGSSAMPYKQNPILSERICSLSRFLIALCQNPAYTHATQWLERSLDDSANRRLSIPEAFLTADAILCLLLRVTKGLTVNEHVIKKHIKEELSFLATEEILLAGVNKGADRQELHERIRIHSVAAIEKVKEGKKNDLLERIASDDRFRLSKNALEKMLNIDAFTGRSSEQVKEYLAEIKQFFPKAEMGLQEKA